MSNRLGPARAGIGMSKQPTYPWEFVDGYAVDAWTVAQLEDKWMEIERKRESYSELYRRCSEGRGHFAEYLARWEAQQKNILRYINNRKKATRWRTVPTHDVSAVNAPKRVRATRARTPAPVLTQHM